MLRNGLAWIEPWICRNRETASIAPKSQRRLLSRQHILKLNPEVVITKSLVKLLTDPMIQSSSHRKGGHSFPGSMILENVSPMKCLSELRGRSCFSTNHYLSWCDSSPPWHNMSKILSLTSSNTSSLDLFSCHYMFEFLPSHNMAHHDVYLLLMFLISYMCISDNILTWTASPGVRRYRL